MTVRDRRPRVSRRTVVLAALTTIAVTTLSSGCAFLSPPDPVSSATTLAPAPVIAPPLGVDGFGQPIYNREAGKTTTTEGPDDTGAPSTTTTLASPPDTGPIGPQPEPYMANLPADIPADSTPLCRAADEAMLAGSAIANLGSTPTSRSSVLTATQQAQGLRLIAGFEQDASALLKELIGLGKIVEQPELRAALAELLRADQSIDVRVIMNSFLEESGGLIEKVLAEVPALCPDGLVVQRARQYDTSP